MPHWRRVADHQFPDPDDDPYGYVDPPTEIFKDGEVQFWKITHNGVDTHFIHFHCSPSR